MKTLVLLALSVLVNGPGSAQDPADPPVAEVLVLGAYHFDNPGRDVAQITVADILSPEKQAEVAAVADALAAFRPTKIVVERRTERGAEVDSLYTAYREGHHALGRSEVEQLGFRLAARLGHDRVYPADHGGEFPFGPLMAYAEEHKPTFAAGVTDMIERLEQEADSLQQTATVTGILRFMNRPDVLRRNHGDYVATAAVGAGDGYAGADLLSAWYDRNVRIFGNIAALVEPGDRVLVIYGAGHAPILRELVGAALDMELVDPSAYL